MEKNTRIDKAHIVKVIVSIAIILSPIYLFFIIPGFFYLYDPDEHDPWVSWFNDPHQRVYIAWETEEETKGIVYYGTDKDNLTDFIGEDKKENIHHVVLTGLSADTKYYYKVEIDDKKFGSGEFKTAPISYKSFKWVMISDTQQNYGPGFHYRVAEVIKDKDYAFIANVGDLVEVGDDKRHYNNFFRVGSAYLDTIPLIPVAGNHEITYTKQDSLFWDYFINNKNNSKDLFFYSFNYSSVHFQIDCFPYGHDYEFVDEQMDWIEQDLKNAKPMPFKVVMFHTPIKGASFFGKCENLIDKVLPLLKKYDVDAVIHGHEHHYERGQFDDVMYMILGSGGGALDVGLRPFPEADFISVAPCYTEVSATEDELNFKTYSLQGDLIDQIKIKD